MSGIYRFKTDLAASTILLANCGETRVEYLFNAKRPKINPPGSSSQTDETEAQGDSRDASYPLDPTGIHEIQRLDVLHHRTLEDDHPTS